MIIRLSKILFVAAISFYCLLTAFGNITDHAANFPGVQHALTMKEIFPHSTIGYRALVHPSLHLVAYGFIISLELLTGLLCAIGAWKLFRARNEIPVVFNGAKHWAIAGLSLGFLTWQVGFMSIGGEWFGMWMSQMLNGALTTAVHIFLTMITVLIYVAMKDD